MPYLFSVSCRAKTGVKLPASDLSGFLFKLFHGEVGRGSDDIEIMGGGGARA